MYIVNDVCASPVTIFADWKAIRFLAFLFIYLFIFITVSKQHTQGCAGFRASVLSLSIYTSV